MTIISIILVFVVALLAGMGSVLDAWQFHQPLVASTLIGVAMGRPIEGIMLGGSLQMITMGWMNIGAAMAPDAALAAIVSAILVTGPAGVSVREGIALAIPLAVAGQVLTIFVRTATVVIAHLADEAARKAKFRTIEYLHFGALLLQGLRVAIPAMLILSIPSTAVVAGLNAIPTVITEGLQIAGGFVVVVGYAMVINMMAADSLWPFFFLGFVLAAVTVLNLIAMGIIGVSLALIYIRLRGKKTVDVTTQQSTFDTSSWKRLTKKDQRSIFYRLGFLLASFNYERMQNIGFGYIMIPAIRRLYPDDKVEQAAAMQRHLEFFNTHPYMAAPIVGVTMALEEERANGAEVDNAAISGVKVGMLGPLAGVGDPVFWGTLRPILGALAASFAANGSWIGPILFFVVWNVMRLLVLWYGEQIGYQQGKNITQNLAGGIMQDVTLGASVLGMFIMGVLVPRWTTIYFPLVVSRVKNPDTGKTVTTTLDQIVNGQLLSGLAALLLTMGVLWLLKRRVNPLAIIFGLFVIGIIGRMLGILGLQA